MEDSGYQVQVKNSADLAPVKNRYQVPTALRSCHTAIVDGYVVEGHVPAADVARMLADKPDIIGLAVPGMPIGSPGMEMEGAFPQPFDVIAFDAGGQMEIYASYHP
ncbi:MAG: DUF411 domain-containing protein [Anaerolineae bacterium]